MRDLDLGLPVKIGEAMHVLQSPVQSPAKSETLMPSKFRDTHPQQNQKHSHPANSETLTPS
jgi:hypothetical protein